MRARVAEWEREVDAEAKSNAATAKAAKPY